MLTFEEKLSIIESFPELERKNVSLKRVNFHFEESRLDKKERCISFTSKWKRICICKWD